MRRGVFLTVVNLFGAALLCAQGGDVVFRSDVSLVRVDAQVLDRNNRAITGLAAEDFILRESGQPQEIRNFSSEELPVDILLLLDVSGSMRPHVERIASAADRAMRVLANDDRVAIMVFDRATRLRMPFRRSGDNIQRELYALVNDETFDGGTDITRALYDAANYIAREGRRDARRAVVILTDDQTERGRDEAGVGRALTRAEAVLSLLLAPDAMGSQRSAGPLSWPNDPLGGIIFGRRGPLGGGGPYGGRRGPGPVVLGSHTQSAGTAEIARRSGGDTFRVEEASALENTLSRLRQRYSLHFYLPEGVRPGEERQIEVELAAAARRRYSDAEVRYRRVYMTPGGPSETPVPESEPAVITRGPEPPPSGSSQTEVSPQAQPSAPQRQGGWRRVDEPARDEQLSDRDERPAEPAASRRPGWRRAEPGDQP
jgi:VWFA-related protein